LSYGATLFILHHMKRHQSYSLSHRREPGSRWVSWPVDGARCSTTSAGPEPPHLTLDGGLLRTDDDSVVGFAVAVAEEHGGGGAGYAAAVEVPACRREGGLVLRADGSGEAVPLVPSLASW
jgi:hypothetical protein